MAHTWQSIGSKKDNDVKDDVPWAKDAVRCGRQEALGDCKKAQGISQ